MTNPYYVRALGALVLVMTGGAMPPAFGQTATDERRTVPAARMSAGERITLDGRLDEAVWMRATPAADFIQVDPSNGRPATEPTEVRIAFDEDAIYLGVTCYDSEPDRWLGYQRRRDEFLGADDRFMWTIDTFLDARSGYFFEMNPSGLMADSIFGVNGDNRAWDGIWNARVRHSEIGWTIEIQIPFKTLNFNPESDTWGMNFQRTVRRKNEDSIWMGWARNQGLRRMTNAGYVTGIREVTQGIGLDVKPYALFTAQSSPGRGSSSFDKDGNAGVDLFYNPTPLLRTNLTINTDFAQTEVDQRQVNLTRFSLFFPERRDFFLDGAIFFDFGSPTNADLRINPFFSRRIGLSATGTPQKIDYGTKVMGQVGGQDVGLLHVRSGNDGDLIGEEFTVARVKRRVLSQSYVGAMYTRRAPRGAGLETRHTAGMDFRLATNRFLGSQNLESGGWFLHATAPNGTGRSNAFGGSIAYPNDLWSLRFDASEVQENFDPGIGFVTRRNYRRYAPAVTYSPRPTGHPYIRRFSFGAATDVQTDLRNDILQRSADLTLLDVNLHSQETFGFEMSVNHERLDQPFRLAPGIELPLGATYDFNRYLIRAQTANRRVLAIFASYGWGDFYSGTRAQTVANLSIRLRPGYIVYFNNEWNRVELPEGDFTTRLLRLVGEAQFSPWVTLVNNIQYDTQSAVLGWQSRFRWIMRPGNDLYVVYTHNWLDDPVLDRFATLDKNIASKVLYTHRF
jgi:hypothetical protein